MTRDKFEIIYNSQKMIDRKLLAYAKTLKTKFSEIDTSKEGLTRRHLMDIAIGFDTKPFGLVDRKQLKESEVELSENFGDDHVLKVLTKHPLLIRTPILIRGKEHHFISDIADLNKISKLLDASKSEHFQS